MRTAQIYTIQPDYTRYGGDSERPLELLVDRNKIYLFYKGFDAFLECITTHPDYIQWLVANHHNLLRIRPETWWNDRNYEYGRYLEFQHILRKLKDVL